MYNKNENSYQYLLTSLHNSKTSRDCVWGSIAYDSNLLPVLEHSLVQRLRNIYQLGPSHLIYPGATHTRYAHSLGVMYLGQKILLHILPQECCPNISIIMLKSFLLATLLHDIGHFPYAHSLKELALPEHEDIAADLIINTEKPKSEEYALHDVITQFGADPYLTAAIITKSYEKNIYDTHSIVQTKKKLQNHIKSLSREETQALNLFRQLLSGALDPDKLDYLCRDAFFCGVPYGIQDINFAISQMRVSSKNTLYLNSLMPIEHILFSKYLMYKSIYWHHKIRSATAMVKHALFHAMKKNIITAKQLIALDDNSLHKLCQQKQSHCKELHLIHKVINKQFHYCIAKYKTNKNLNNTLYNLEKRSKIEMRISKKLNIPHIIIDLPENINFEFPYMSFQKKQNDVSIFSKGTAHKFTSTLRQIRVFAPLEHKRLLKNTEQQFLDTIFMENN